jgi:LPS sulfotransferase NodH
MLNKHNLLCLQIIVLGKGPASASSRGHPQKMLKVPQLCEWHRARFHEGTPNTSRNVFGAAEAWYKHVLTPTAGALSRSA